MKKNILTMLIFFGLVPLLHAQVKPPITIIADTTKKAVSVASSNKSKSYDQVITNKAITKKGMITSHKIDEKYFFEIADTLLGRDILIVNRISKSGSDVRAAQGYAGDEIGRSIIRFEKGPNDRIFLKNISFATYSTDSTSSMYQSLKNSNIQPIISSFNIVATTTDNKGSVIDITTFLNGDNEILYFGSSTLKSKLKLGAPQADRSYVLGVRSFPTNVEINTVKTYSLTPGSSPYGLTTSNAATIELNSSLVLLPKVPMKPRYLDKRIGYFNVGYTDFDVNPHGIEEIQMIMRWKLEPKPQDMAKYKRGELVEPKKPIVFYIDPATPKKWIPYLIAGVNDWAKAFEKAGFKNAVMGKEAPTKAQDSTWSLEDARHSAIVYKPSEIPNANAPIVFDPRSGEILESHINWFHNVQKLLHDWYMIQTAAVDPRARKMTFSDELMGDLIRFVSSHEVGHTLGLLHNYGSSSTVPVENLRNKKWVEENGHTPSIMDYARFNYVAQPEDNISSKGLYPRIGDYDKWAIEWGYRYFPDSKNVDSDMKILDKMTLEAAKNRRLWFGTEANKDDPNSQNEDLGDNAMIASDYGIKNLKVILSNLSEWTKVPGKGYENLAHMYDQVVAQYNRYLGHVIKNIGGVYENPKIVDQPGMVYERTPVSKQKQAIDFFSRQLFDTPKWLINQQILNNIDQSSIEIIAKLQSSTLIRLLSSKTLSKLIDAEASEGPKAYKISDLFTDLNKAILSELKTNTPIDIYRRNLQKAYIDRLVGIVKPAQTVAATIPSPTNTNSKNSPFSFPTELTNSQSDTMSETKNVLRELRISVKSAAANQSDPASKHHLMDLYERIEAALDSKIDN
ncbi:MAG: zinc-dependent metalloprotease [Bacteroidota bacterium]